MRKQFAIMLLGGTPTEASKVLHQTPQAVSAWPEVLSESQEAFVLFKYNQLPQNKRREYMAAAKATEAQA